MTVGVSAPRWAPDPVGRFAQRFWDGARWTEHVAGPGGGAPERDLLLRNESEIPSVVRAEPETPVKARTGAGERPLEATPPADSEPAAFAGAAATRLDANAAVWAPDPTGRHAQRYWDGSQWTDFVAPAGGGAPEHDALPSGVALLAPGIAHSVGAISAPGAENPTAANDVVSDPPVEPAPSDASVPSTALATTFGTAGAVASAPTPPAAQWAVDPSGRHPQRYWDGAAWTGFVAGAAGGAAVLDALTSGEVWPAPDRALAADAVAAGAVGGTATGASWSSFARPVGIGAGVGLVDHDGLLDSTDTAPVPATAAVGSKRRKLIAATVLLVLLAAAIAALAFTGVLGGDGARAKNAGHPTRVGAARAVAGPKPAAGSATPTTAAAPASGPVNPGIDPCGLLDPPSIAKATGLAVGAGRPVESGCAWQGVSTSGIAGSAQNRQILGAHEGVVLSVHPPGANRQSVTCTATLPGVSAPGGVCTLPGADGHYSMFQVHGFVVEIAIVSVRPSTDTQLAQLAQVAYSRSQ